MHTFLDVRSMNTALDYYRTQRRAHRRRILLARLGLLTGVTVLGASVGIALADLSAPWQVAWAAMVIWFIWSWSYLLTRHQ